MTRLVTAKPFGKSRMLDAGCWIHTPPAHPSLGCSASAPAPASVPDAGYSMLDPPTHPVASPASGCHPDRRSEATKWRDPFDSAFGLARNDISGVTTPSPHFSPGVYCGRRMAASPGVYCGRRMAAICRAFRKSCSSTYCGYAVVARFPKNPTSDYPSPPSLRNPVRSAG